jgi:hypothetical protein
VFCTISESTPKPFACAASAPQWIPVRHRAPRPGLLRRVVERTPAPQTLPAFLPKHRRLRQIPFVKLATRGRLGRLVSVSLPAHAQSPGFMLTKKWPTWSQAEMHERKPSTADLIAHVVCLENAVQSFGHRVHSFWRNRRISVSKRPLCCR